MSLLDHLFDGFGPTPGGRGLLRHNVRAGKRLLAGGRSGTGRVTGIRIRPGGDDTIDRHEFRIEVGGAVAGCRQQLGRLAREIRLGMEVPIRSDDRDRVIIDVPRLGGDADAWGYKPLGEPPGAGIADPGLRLDPERGKSAPATITVLGAERSLLLGSPTGNADLRVRVEPAEGDGFETVIRREAVPFYATHLAAEGTALAGLSRTGRQDKVRIDWPASALADPGVGRPPADLGDEIPDEMDLASVGDPPSDDWSPEGLAASDPGTVEGVPFDTWVAVEVGLVRERVPPADHDAYARGHGIPAGSWATVQAAWHQQMRSDPRVGARFGAAFSDGMARR